MEAAKDKKRVQMSLMIAPELRRLIRRIAAESDSSQSDVVNDALTIVLGMPEGAQQSPTQ